MNSYLKLAQNSIRGQLTIVMVVSGLVCSFVTAVVFYQPFFPIYPGQSIAALLVLLVAINVWSIKTAGGIISYIMKANKQIESQRLAAEEAGQAKSEFLANMSHEIRTPLNAIIGMSTLLRDSALNDEQKEFAEIIGNSSDNLLSLINDILDFSKIEAGKMELEKIGFDLRDLIDQVLDVVSLKASDRDVEVVAEFDEQISPSVVGDRTRLNQVLLNLADNAVKFIKDGDVVINVKCKEYTPISVTYSFSVTDTGPGIPPEKLDNLFMYFSQADVSTSRNYGGTGLGLAISQRLCRAMGSEIEVTTQMGQGSTFYFDITFDRPSKDIRTPVKDLGFAENKSVLLIYKSSSAREVYQKYLEDIGCMVGTASSLQTGSEILQYRIARDEPIDVVIIDKDAGDFNDENLRSIINYRKQHSIKVVVVSKASPGHSTPQEIPLADSTLRKPLKKSELSTVFQDLYLERKAGDLSEAEASSAAIAQAAIAVEEAVREFKILLVEDNPTNQLVAKRLLQKFGYGCDTAKDGQEAVDAVRVCDYDLVLLDCQMPRKDGYAACQEIRESEVGRRHTPIVALTARALQGDREKCLAAGMDDYITKPVKSEVLRSILEKYLPELPST